MPAAPEIIRSTSREIETLLRRYVEEWEQMHGEIVFPGKQG